MKLECYKLKADEAKGKKKPCGGRRDGGHGGGPQAGAALAYTASAGKLGSRKAHGSTSGSSTWVLDSGATIHMAAGDKGFTVQAARSGAKVTLANGDKVPIKGHGHVSMDVGKGSTKARMVLAEAMLVPDLTSNLLSVRAVDRNRGAVVFVGDACYILSDGEAVHASGVLDKASVVGKVNDREQYVFKVTPVKASANAASTSIAGEAELWHRRFNHLGIENLKRAAKMVDGMPSSVADAARVVGTVCVSCVDGKMVQAPHLRSSIKTTKCDLVHTDVGGPLTESLGGSIYFITALEDSTGFITATPSKTKGMASQVLKTRIKQLETLTGVHVKRVRHDGAKEYLTNELKVWYEDKGIPSEMTAPYKAQQNGKAERVNRTLMERLRAALLDAGAEEELWAEALDSFSHVLNRSPKAGLDVMPLEALTGRRPNVSGFRVWGSRAWALKPKKQQRKLEPRTDAGRFVGYTVGEKPYRILEDGTDKVFERRDVLMEEKSAKADSSGDGSSAGTQLTITEDSDSNGGMDESMDMLDAERDGGEKTLRVEDSESEDDGDPDSLADDKDDEERQGPNDSMLPVGISPSEVYNAAPRPRRSTRRPAPKVTWWEKDPKAYLATGSESAAKDGRDVPKPPANEKEARARPDWPLWKQAIKEEVAAHKKLGTWSTTKGGNKQHKAIRKRFLFDIKHDAEGQKSRYKARLVAEGFNQVPGRDFDETWAPVPNTATSRALLAVAAANGWEVHHVDVKTAFLNAKIDKEMYIKLPEDVESGEPADVRRLNLALYGAKQAGRLWGIKVNDELEQMGATRSAVDPCLYEWHHPVHARVFILVYFDDLIVAGERFAGVKAIKSGVAAMFEVRDMGEVEDFIGMKVMRDKKTKKLTLSNPGHIMALLQAFGMDTYTPNKKEMASGVKLSKTGENLLPDGNRYAELVGPLLYLSTTTRPDIAFDVGVLSRFMSCPEQDHMRAAKGVLRYVRGPTFLGVMYGGKEALQGYVAADWAGDIDGRRSTTGFFFTLNGGPISSASKRQSTVATSTDVAEYAAAAMSTKEALWIRKLLWALGGDGGAVPMGEDDQSCLALLNNPEVTGRTKHVDVAYHMVRDYQARGDVAFYFLPSAEMPADGLTKPLPSPAFRAFRAAVGAAEDLGAVARGDEVADPQLGAC